MQINLTGFLTTHTSTFMKGLWELLLEAQESPAGVPQRFVEEKKAEMRAAREGDTRALEERDRRKRLDEIRDQEKNGRMNDRPRGGGGGGGGGGDRGRGRGRGGWGGPPRDRDSGWGAKGGPPGDNGWGDRGGGGVSNLAFCML
jgi:serine/arginine repetitive matrix protein 1